MCVCPCLRTFRFFQGVFKIGVFTTCFVWCMEVVGGDWKTYVGMGLEFPWVISWLILALLVGGWIQKIFFS